MAGRVGRHPKALSFDELGMILTNSTFNAVAFKK